MCILLSSASHSSGELTPRPTLALEKDATSVKKIKRNLTPRLLAVTGRGV